MNARRTPPLRLAACVFLCVSGSAFATEAPSRPAWPEPPAQGPGATPRARPTTAAEALEHAVAAYEYGDMSIMVEASRMVADGALVATDAERADALRLLGIGLYFTGRIEGADVAFSRWLDLRPAAGLDPTVTRPEVVSFFAGIRRRRIEAQRAQRAHPAWALLPPVGQFHNGDRGRGYAILAVGGLALATNISTYVALRVAQNDDLTSDLGNAAQTVKTACFISLGVVVATYAYGVVDALVRRNRAFEDEVHNRGTVGLRVVPGGAALTF